MFYPAPGVAKLESPEAPAFAQRPASALMAKMRSTGATAAALKQRAFWFLATRSLNLGANRSASTLEISLAKLCIIVIGLKSAGQLAPTFFAVGRLWRCSIFPWPGCQHARMCVQRPSHLAVIGLKPEPFFACISSARQAGEGVCTPVSATHRIIMLMHATTEASLLDRSLILTGSLTYSG